MKQMRIIGASLAIALVIGVMQAGAVLTLPIADDANTQAGLMRLGGGVTLESDLNLYGGRFTYGVADGIALFGGAGLADPDGLDSEPYLQLGGQFKLPVHDLPMDLAIRAGFGYVSFSDSEPGFKADWDIWMINVGLLASWDLDVVTVYGFGGISYQNYDLTVTQGRLRFSEDDTETELAIGGGVIFPVNDQVSFYGELMHIDELFISLGGRFDF